MFTGLIQSKGLITYVERTMSSRRFSIKSHAINPKDLRMGMSIACSGCCLTVVEHDKRGNFTVDVSPETLERTTLGEWGEGTSLNMEMSLKVGDALDGHMVTGHVDGKAVVESIEVVEKNYRRIELTAPEELKAFIAQKGSVALDGVSLTVNSVDDRRFDVMIIPHTWDVTTISDWYDGAEVNLEIDPLARYVARMREVMEHV